MSERRPLQGANNQTKGQRQEKAGRRSDLSTTSCDDLVLGPKGDRCQWMFVTVAGDVDVETSESTDEKKRKSRVRRSDKRPAKSLEKGKQFKGWTGRQTDRQIDRRTGV